jgi:FkbM family methyltransferase
MRTATEKLDLQQAFREITLKQEPGFRHPVKAEVKTFWGDYLKVTIPETVSTQIAFHQYYEKDLTHVLIECLEPEMVFFDIGAHYGYFTLLAANIVGPRGRVHSFEPTKETYELLVENTRGHQNITVNNKAVYSETTELSFRNLGAGLSAFNSLFAPRLDPAYVEKLNVEIQRVPAVSIDDYVEATGIIPNFIKVNAESAEFQILEGMKDTPTEHRPMFTLEVGDGDIEGVRTCKEIVSYALGFGYRVFSSTMGVIVPHHVKPRYSYNNLLFLPEKKY